MSITAVESRAPVLLRVSSVGHTVAVTGKRPLANNRVTTIYRGARCRNVYGRRVRSRSRFTSRPVRGLGRNDQVAAPTTNAIVTVFDGIGAAGNCPRDTTNAVKCNGSFVRDTTLRRYLRSISYRAARAGAIKYWWEGCKCTNRPTIIFLFYSFFNRWYELFYFVVYPVPRSSWSKKKITPKEENKR